MARLTLQEYLSMPWWLRGPHQRRHRTGRGNFYTYFEQHWRGGGRTRGKKQIHRFPQNMLKEASK